VAVLRQVAFRLPEAFGGTHIVPIAFKPDRLYGVRIPLQENLYSVGELVFSTCGERQIA
jgi:hypothetical protein